MQLPKIPTPDVLALLFLSLPVSSMLRCDNIRVDNVSFNLKALGGPHSVVTSIEEPPSISNTSYTVDICAPLKRKGDVPKEEECENGTRVCAIRHVHEGGKDIVQRVIPISHADHGTPLEWTRERINQGNSNTDAEKEGLRLILGGGKYEKVKQRAIIEFLCDPDKEGTEGEWTPEDEYDKSPTDDSEDEEEEAKRELGKRDDDDGASWADRGKQLTKDGAALKFISYKPEKNGDFEGGVLRLEWKTKYACEKRSEDGGDEARHWGFFTWLFIIVFLGISAYLIFGSWLNYTRYGARGWDLVPHGDTIRDIPYLMKDWSRSVLNTVQGSGTRGGYSAV